jgi:uncharacterized integral membrane protein (TIGR00697 family)
MTYSHRFVVVAALFVTVLVTSNILAVKLIEVAGLVLPAAIIMFPIGYILGDVLTEVYGYRQTRRVIWLGFSMNLIAVAAIWAAGMLPAAGFWQGQDAWNATLGQAPRILAASFIAYLIGEFANAYVMAKIKIATGGRMLWLRTISSTIIGQGLDSAVFITLAFAGVIPPSAILAAILGQWFVKSAYEALATPVTYAVVGYLKKAEGIDVYDIKTRFNPLAVD